jgi:HEAT repeat protein
MNLHCWVTGFVVAIVPLVAVTAGSADDDAEIKALVLKLKHEDPKERAQAADDLCSLGKEAKPALPALLELNKDKDWYVRSRMAMALSAIGKDLRGEGPEVAAAVKLLMNALKDTKAADNVRFEVLQEILKALGEIGSREEGGHGKTVVAAVIPMLKHQDGFVRGKACDALQDCKDHAKAAVPRLVEMLRDSHSYAKNSAIQALREIDPETAKKYGIE